MAAGVPRARLDPDEVRAVLGTAYPWPQPALTVSTESTNHDVAALAAGGAPEGTVVLAEQQTAGRGRLDRRWEAPASAALTWSVLLRPEVPVDRWGWLPLLTGVAVVRALRGHGLDVGLKWPNDVVVGAGADLRKLGGVLVEQVPGADAAVVGVGLNVDQTRAELPVPEATSLALEGHPVARAVLLADVLRALHRRYAGWVQAGGDAAAAGLADDYRDDCRTIGQRVRAELPGGRVLVGTAEDVDAGGRLLVTTDDGATAVVGAGDVVHLRSPDVAS